MLKTSNNRNRVLTVAFLLIFFSSLVYIGCKFKYNKTTSNPPSNNIVTTTVTIPRPEVMPEGINIDFVNGPCHDLFTNTFTVITQIWYIDGNGNEVQSGVDQVINGVTMPSSGPITLPNVWIPDAGEYYVHVFYRMDACSECCSSTYLSGNGINEGCDAILATNYIKQGKPEFVFESQEISGGIPTNINLSLVTFTCYCDCL